MPSNIVINIYLSVRHGGRSQKKHMVHNRSHRKQCPSQPQNRSVKELHCIQVGFGGNPSRDTKLEYEVCQTNIAYVTFRQMMYDCRERQTPTKQQGKIIGLCYIIPTGFLRTEEHAVPKEQQSYSMHLLSLRKKWPYQK